MYAPTVTFARWRSVCEFATPVHGALRLQPTNRAVKLGRPVDRRYKHVLKESRVLQTILKPTLVHLQGRRHGFESGFFDPTFCLPGPWNNETKNSTVFSTRQHICIYVRDPKGQGRPAYLMSIHEIRGFNGHVYKIEILII